MEKEEIMTRVAACSECDGAVVERVCLALCAVMGEALAQGREASFLPELGRFIPKLNDNPGRDARSPRTPKAPDYTVRFRPGALMERKLRQGAAARAEERKNELGRKQT